MPLRGAFAVNRRCGFPPCSERADELDRLYNVEFLVPTLPRRNVSDAAPRRVRGQPTVWSLPLLRTSQRAGQALQRRIPRSYAPA